MKESQDRAKSQYEETQRLADERAAAAAAAENQRVDATRQMKERANMAAEDKGAQTKRKLSIEEQEVAKASWTKVRVCFPCTRVLVIVAVVGDECQEAN